MRVFQQSLVVVAILLLIGVLAEARFPEMDGVTMHEPHLLRAAVAGFAMRELGPEDNEVDRVLMLDPENARAWERRCTAALGPSPGQSVGDCERAYTLDPSLPNLRALASAEEVDGRFCDAEGTFKQALGRQDPEVRRPAMLRDEARVALACGHAETALESLQQAEELDAQLAAGAERQVIPTYEQTAGMARESLAFDRGYMAAVYERMNQPEKARQMCTEANPDSPNCSCELTGNALTCSQTSSYTVASR